MNTTTGQVQAQSAQTSVGTTQQPTGPVSVSEAAAILARHRQQAVEARAAEQVQDEGAVEGLVPDEIGDGDGQMVEDQSAQDTGDGEAIGEDAGDGEAAPSVFSIDGEEFTEDQIREWRDAGLRTADYQRKTQVLSDKERVVDALSEDINRHSHALRRVIEAQLGGLLGEVQKFNSVDWGKLASTDVDEFNRQKARYEVAKERAAQGQQAYVGFLQEYDALTRRALEAKAQAALPVLKTRIKGWSNGLYAELSKFTHEVGAPEEVVAKVTDPWFWEIVNDAYAYRKGQKAATAGKKVTVSSPKRSIPAGPRVTSGERQRIDEQRLRDSAAKGSPRDQMGAAVALMQARRTAQQPAVRRR